MEIPEINEHELGIILEASRGDDYDLLSVIPDESKDNPEQNKRYIFNHAAIDHLVEIGLLWEVSNDPKEAYERRMTMAKLEQSTGRKFRVLALTEIAAFMFVNPISETVN